MSLPPLPITGVSVIIPHYGDPTHAQRLTSQLQMQATSREIQVIVVDDASPVPFPNAGGVQVVRRTANGGFGSAVNTGAAEATQPYLLVLNSDVDIDIDFVESLCVAAGRWQPAVAGVRLESVDGRLEWGARRWPRLSHFLVAWATPLARMRYTLIWHRAVGHDLRGRERRQCAVDWLVGAVLFLPGEAFNEVGGFDERFFMNGEEVDLQMRLKVAGVPRVYLGDITARHLGGGSSGSATQRIRWLIDGRRHYAEKWEGPRGRARLDRGLRLISRINFLWNTLRWLLRRDVSPLASYRRERSLLLM